MSVQSIRAKKINNLLKIIKSYGETGATLKYLLGVCSVNFGYKTTTIKEYIESLENADLIHIDGELITAILRINDKE